METNEDLAVSDAPSAADDLALRASSTGIDGAIALEGIADASGYDVQREAPSTLMRARERTAAFDVDLGRIARGSRSGPVSQDLAHELRGRLNAIVLQVEVIKQDWNRRDGEPEPGDQDRASGILALERELRRLKQALRDFLEPSAPATPIEEAFGRAS